ncbi:MAG: arsenate reductase (glutaredoxin) [Gammaproteobacteria bacterium]|nr:arsenate reductase (glutaredoxin) [Gammaproteobacteria bacterium]
MNITLYHNPNCSKSRRTLELLEENGVKPNIVSYLTEPPAAESIVRLAGLLSLKVADLLRKGEEDAKNASDLPPVGDEAALADWIEKHPETLQRPIAVDEDTDRAIIGRPPENVLQLLQK